MKKQVGQFLIAFTLIFAIGGHWALLQSVAWVGMLANNVRQGSLTEAIEKTFDGEHPCSLCKVVSAGKKADQKQTIVKVEAKLDFWLEPATYLLIPPRPAGHIPPQVHAFTARAEPPPTPPPRVV